jgi:hypothetical protein
MADDIIKVGDEEVNLDPGRLEFNEANLTQYLMSEGGWFNYFGQKLSDLEYALDRLEVAYETKYAEVFVTLKDEGGSDNYVKSKTEANKDLVAAKLRIADVKYRINKIKLHMRAWDKNHENAQSVGHTLRREMDKLHTDIRHFSPSVERGLNEQVDKIIKAIE